MSRSPRLFLLIGLAALLVGITASAWADPPQQAHVPDQVIIKFKANTPDQEKTRILSDLQATKLKHFKRIKGDLERIQGLTVGEAIGRYKNHPAIEIIEPNYILQAEEIPNDPRFGELWGMRNIGQTGGTPGADIMAENAWDVFTGSGQVVIGVIDTGVDYSHPDLAANIYTNPGEIAGNGIDDDGNGFVDDVRGWDFINEDNDPMDDNGHGTHCSGTIGGVGNNGIGVAGVNWHVQIMPLKFLSASGSGSTADAIECIEYATMMGVRLTSNSWGGGGYSVAMEQAIADAGAAGILFVAAAGNSGSNNDASPHYPSSYNLPNVVAVAATDHNDELASFSSYGATSVDLAAPGVDILSTLPGNSYGLLSGTSMATPHVSGALGLVFGRFPAIDGEDAKSLLLNFVDPVPDLVGRVLTEGRLNAFFPIAEPDTIPPGAITDLAAVDLGSNWAHLEWTAPGDDDYDGQASRYDLRWSTSPIDEMNWDLATRVLATPDPGPVGTLESMRVDGLDFDTFYYFATRALDEFGNMGPVSNLATGTTLGVPVAAVAPASLSESLLTGASSMQSLTLSNVADGTLDFTVPIPVLLGSTPTVAAAVEYAKGEFDPREGEPVALGSGGPDGYGYRWNDSNDAFGPTFDWVDISGVGAAALTTGDDVSAGPFAIGFDFPFYGAEFSEFYVSSNGTISFTSSASPYSNQPLPTPSAPPHLVAPFWDDLDVGAGTVYYHNDGDRLIVQYDGVAHYSAGGPYTFEAILWPDGTIDYQYLSMGAPDNSATVGIQNGDGSDGLTVAFNTTYVTNDLAVRIQAVPQWMTVTPTAGTVYGGSSTTLDVAFDATGLLGGTYDGIIRILSNDPVTPDLQVPVTLDVTGAPDVAVEPLSFDFGGVFLGATPTTQIAIRNVGTDVLTVSSLTVDEAAFGLDLVAPLAIPPRGSATLTVTFAPTMVQMYTGTLSVVSDDPDESTVSVSLSGEGLEPPQFAIDPTSLYADLLTGESEMQQLTITNSGGADFIFSLTVQTEASVTVHEYVEVGKEEIDARVGDPVTQGNGGPDVFGYRWIDSDEPGGPVFNWVDISTTGTPVFTSYSDDRNAGPFPVGFTFPFYGNSFSEFNVCSNGWVSFTSTSTSLSNQLLPNSGAPENLLAAFWDDLKVDPVNGSNVYYEYDGSRLIIQYDNVPRYSSGGPYTFQTILYPNGKILFQYLSMQGTRLNEATIGIQNDAKDDGLTVVFNAAYVHDNMAVLLASAPEWLTATPSSGVVPPGGSMMVDVLFNAEGLFGGTYTGSIDFVTNDPSVPALAVPAVMDVTGAPDIAVSLTEMDFGPVMIGYPDLLNLTVLNLGTDDLVLSGYTMDNTDFQVNLSPPVTLSPMSQLLLDVRFAPSVVGMASATLSFQSNDPDTPAMDVLLLGEGIVAPVASVSPTSLFSDLLTGQQDAQTITLTNDGGSDLVYSVLPMITADEVFVAEYVEVGKDETDPRPGVLGSGGPDLFGYQWIDSDEPGGPAFDWIDISATGTPVFTSYSDDRNAGPFPVGFTFPFYGTDFTEFRVCSNGWVSFTSTSTSLSNQLLPNSGAPENLLAAFWDDLKVDPANGSNVYYEYDGSRLIIQYDNVPRYSSGGPYTFEILLYPNGTIVYQYLDMQGTRLNEATLGVQNGARDDGLTVVFNADYVHDNLAVRIGTTPQWLTVTPTDGIVPPGGSQPISVTFDATGLFGGDYDGAIQILNNDPAHGLLEVLASLHVTGVPDLAVDPLALDFGSVYLTVSETLPLMVINQGTDLLSVASITSSNGDYTLSPSSFDLPPLSAQEVLVTFAPSEAGDRSAELTIASNDPDTPLMTVPLAGIGVVPPDIDTNPAMIEAAAMPGGQKIKTLTVCNTGGSDLVFNVSSAENLATSVTQYDYLAVEKEGEDPRPGILGSGGPDLFGYTWVDSDDPAGPAFDWVDISAVGTPTFGAYSDDGNRGPFPIGFDFSFYGNDFSAFRVCSNGWLSFTSTATSYTNQPLPNSGAPDNLLAIFWDDMVVDPSYGGEIYYHNDGTRLIVQYQNVRRIGAFTPPFYNFEIILYPNGTIVYQYEGLGTTLNSATVGIQNATKDDGLMAVYNGTYIHENLAVRFSSRPAWLTVEPTEGTVPAGECVELTVTFDAAELEAGDYTGTIEITSNDPDESVVTTDVLLHVGLIEATWADVDPNTLNLDSNGKYITGRFELPTAYDPCDVVLETVSILGQVPADSQAASCEQDGNGNGIPDSQYKFSRAAVEEILPEGDRVAVCIYGEVEDTTWFVACDTIRVIRPHMKKPHGATTLLAGTPFTVEWDDPQGWNVDSSTLIFSADGGEVWELVAENLHGSSYEWTVPSVETEQALLRIMVYDHKGAMGYDSTDEVFTISLTATGIDRPAGPRVYALRQNVPNPFNPRTTIYFDLPHASRVELRIYDVRGRLIRTLVSEDMPSGYHEIPWSGKDDQGRQVSSGVYYYRIQADDFRDQKRMVILK